jgi:hypothetical protein
MNNSGHVVDRAARPQHHAPAQRKQTMPMKNKHLLPVLIPLAALLSGCQVLTYQSPSGETFSRTSLGAHTTVAALVVETSTNGVRRLELRGYQNDTAQALTAVTEAAVRAAVQATLAR